jgi:membrane fusion protein (multidrug efflux system)
VRIVLDPATAPPLLRPGLSIAAEVDTRDDPDAPRGLLDAAAARFGQLFGR